MSPEIPLSSPESMNLRENILYIVTAYRDRHPETVTALTAAGIEPHISPLTLTEYLLDHELDTDTLTTIATGARTYLSTFTDNERLDKLDRASDF